MPLRLVAWNSCAGPLTTKLSALDSLKADIAVVPECPKVPPGATAHWLGDNPRRGLAVFATPPWHLEPVTVAASLPHYIQPFQVRGPESFLLWAVWAHNHNGDRYVRGVHRAVDVCEDLIKSQPSVLLGDFNSNTIWDHENPRDRGHSALVTRLQSLGLVSAYHVLRRQEHGRETRPTFFEYRHKHRPYHIDYAFIPMGWVPRLIGVTVGRHSRWARWSDHMPLSVDLASAAV